MSQDLAILSDGLLNKLGCSAKCGGDRQWGI